jgi:hypothetical protein
MQIKNYKELDFEILPKEARNEFIVVASQKIENPIPPKSYKKESGILKNEFKHPHYRF